MNHHETRTDLKEIRCEMLYLLYGVDLEEHPALLSSTAFYDEEFFLMAPKLKNN